MTCLGSLSRSMKESKIETRPHGCQDSVLGTRLHGFKPWVLLCPRADHRLTVEGARGRELYLSSYINYAHTLAHSI